MNGRNDEAELSALGRLTRLTQLDLYEYENLSGAPFEFAGLPDSLKGIYLSNCSLSTTALHLEENNSIEKLGLTAMPATMCANLQRMPRLKVLPLPCCPRHPVLKTTSPVRCPES